tara:strand:+ start:644 stop:790 length:147 start_codon:yes stop_codon:yes gene_type:complete
LKDSDKLLSTVNGTPPNEGLMVEIVRAIALGKTKFLFRDDFCKCTDSE